MPLIGTQGLTVANVPDSFNRGVEQSQMQQRRKHAIDLDKARSQQAHLTNSREERADLTQKRANALLGKAAGLPTTEQQQQGAVLTPEQAFIQANILDPNTTAKVYNTMGIRTKEQANEAAAHAFKLNGLSDEQQLDALGKRADWLDSQGRDSTHTRQIMTEEYGDRQNSLAVLRVAALNPKQQQAILSGGLKIKVSNLQPVEGGGFVGVKTLPDGSVESVYVPAHKGVRTQAQADAHVKKETKRVADEVKAGKTQFDRSKQLRTEIHKASKDFQAVDDAYGRIEVSAKEPSAAGDLALIFNYMKMLDPGSVVRESEFATAANSAGVPDRIRAQYNKVLSGERLAIAQRDDFVKTAKGLHDRALRGHNKVISKFVDIGKQYGVSRGELLGREEQQGNEVVPQAAPQQQAATKDMSSYSDVELDAIIAGEGS